MKVIGILPAGTLILGICTFRGMLVIATDRGVYRCRPDGELEKVDL